jgi:hypothetical protein
MYDASIGRFLQRDPLSYYDSMNLYQYVHNNPVNYIDPLGLVKIEVRYNKLGGIGSASYYHAYVVVTDNSGRQTYYRGGPSAGGPSGGSSGQLSSASGGSSSGASGSNSNSSNSTSPCGKGGNSGPWGAISTNSGPYVPGTIDWNPNKTPSVTVLDNSDPAGPYNQALRSAFNKIGNANIVYNPLRTNSNSAAHQAIQDIGLPRPKAPVWAPGSSTDLWK